MTTAPTPTLLPCPFCGGKPHHGKMMDESMWSRRRVPWRRVRCNECDISTDWVCKGASPSEIERWNRRAELEARKPLPLSDEQLRAEFIPWAEIQYRHEDEFSKRDFKICLAAWSAGRRAALVDKSPDLQEPLVDKTANLQDQPLSLSDDDRLRLRSDVARAIWDVMREHEDRCDHALEDVEHKHQVWDCADAAIETALGIIPRPNPLIASREVVADGPLRVTRLHLTEEGRAGLTSKATGPLPGITGGSS